MIALILSEIWIYIFSQQCGGSTAQDVWCGYPGAPAFGRPHPLKERYSPGESVSFSCEPGYALQGPLKRTCGTMATWQGPMPLCDRSLSSEEQWASSRSTLHLYPANHSSDGDPRTCTYTDKLPPRWIRIDMRTQRRVRAVELTVPHAAYAQDVAQLTIFAISVQDSTTATYHKCATFNGRFTSRTLRVSCAGGGVWGRYIHVQDDRHRVDYFSLCEIHIFLHKGSYECGEAERPTHAYSIRTESGEVQYKCVHGYKLEGPVTRRCNTDGQWSQPQPICTEISCPLLPERAEGGRLVYWGRVEGRAVLGTSVNVSCDYGYQPTGGSLHCHEDGRWSPGTLHCERVECNRPTLEQGVVLLNGTSYGSVALVRCPQGESTIVCREDGTWSTPEPPCNTHQDAEATLGLIEEEQGDVPTGVVIGMAVVVFLLLVAVFLVLVLKRRKVVQENSTDSLPSKVTSEENDGFYDTIPGVLNTVLFPNRHTQGDTPPAGCIYEEVGHSNTATPSPTEQTTSSEAPIYARVDLDEKRRSRQHRQTTAQLDNDDVDLEPIKLRELPPIPRHPDEGTTYASLSPPLDPPPSTMKDNELYSTVNGITLKV